jgi:hypothetical protein
MVLSGRISLVAYYLILPERVFSQKILLPSFSATPSIRFIQVPQMQNFNSPYEGMILLISVALWLNYLMDKLSLSTESLF